MNRARKLTDVVVKSAKPEAVEYSLRDSAIRGFALRVQPSGSKTWILRITRGGETRRITIGDAEAVSTDRARTQALRMLSGDVSQPVSSGPRFKDFAADYVARRQAFWKPSGRRSLLVYLNTQLIPAFGAKHLASITPADVARWFYDYSASAPGGANRAADILRDLFNRAIDWDQLPEGHQNPCVKLIRNRRAARGRLLSLDQIAILGAKLDEITTENPDAADCIRLILLTGCRSGEIGSLRWADVHPDGLHLPDSKTGPRIVPLGQPAKELLASRRPTPAKGWVFPNYQVQKPSLAIYFDWIRIRQAAGLPSDIRVHDLRHTFASHSVMAGESLMITSRLLGHQNIATTSRYAHLRDAHLLSAAQNVADRLCAIGLSPARLVTRTRGGKT